MTRNHIEVWHERVMPPGVERITFRRVLCGSWLPILVWAGMACFASVVFAPLAALVIGGLFALSFLAGFALRRKAGHSVRCSLFGAVGGVFDKSMAGF